jgi:phosphoenolpyruvate-protein kinase (PTS system EI component)
LLGRRDLFTSQARAIARASIEGPVDVMYPMVVDLNQFFLLRQIFSEATAGLSTSAIRHGVMFEVPAACLRAEELLGAADFGSIGTNDLIQYLLAVDRNNSLVAGDYSADSGVLWDVLAAIAAAATKTGRDVSVCGELAANVEYVRRLQELGYTTLSVSSRFISKIRSAANGP